jgi:succinate dehydrogenase/fumarate reductase cytochrome b subunit
LAAFFFTETLPSNSANSLKLMNKIFSIVLLVAGVVLIIYGINASHSIVSDFSRLFTGSPTDKSIWLLIGGIVAAAIGLGGIVRGSN